VRLEAAASKEITVDMTARVGQVTVNVLPGEATVYVDGQAQGKGSITVNLSSAPHRLEVKQAGYAEFARTVTPRPGYPQTINVRLLSDAEVVARSTARSITSSQGQEMRRVE
ncbi:MAG: PEGA domain-containing protein, partial [Woeseiales bacterium]